MLWVCHVIVDVFSQHGCFIIKSLSKFVKALGVSVSGAEFERREQPSAHICMSACTRPPKEGMDFYSAHTVNGAKALKISFQSINAMSLLSPNTCEEGTPSRHLKHDRDMLLSSVL